MLIRSAHTDQPMGIMDREFDASAEAMIKKNTDQDDDKKEPIKMKIQKSTGVHVVALVTV